MKTILKKELKDFFSSLTGYIIILFFISVMSILLWINPNSSIINDGRASMQIMFDFAPYFMAILCPIITMRIWTKEKDSGMIEILLTSPLKVKDIILGKYVATLLIIIFCLLPTITYYLSIYFFSSPIGNIDNSVVIGSYFGLFILSCTFLAIGFFASIFGNSALVTLVVGIALCFSYFFLLDVLSNFVFFKKIAFLLNNMSANSNYYSLTRGLIDSRDIIYFLVTIIFMLYLTIILVDKRN